MISRIKIDNFRSIIETDVKLNKLSVVIGANGSGKSNFIKALEFLSKLSTKGLETTLYTSGGFESLLPKFKYFKNAQSIQFDYTVELDSPINEYPNSLLPIEVRHRIKFSEGKKYPARIDDEEIVFEKAILFSKMNRVGSKSEQVNDAKLKNYKDHKVKIYRKFNHKDRIEFYPKFEETLIKDYLGWIGLPFFEEVESEEKFLQLLETVLLKGSIEQKQNKISIQNFLPVSLIEPKSSTYSTFSPQARRFEYLLNNIRRYDFEKHYLRSPQLPGEKFITAEGKNIPSALRDVKRNSPESWKRILRTMRRINPYIDKIEFDNLKSGDEFIFFKESNINTEIESWITSDGTLQSLAILLALETHQKNSTIIIEEPEQNIHPWAIESLVSHVREVIKQRNIQVIFTTHSPQLLENVKPNEVYVCNKTRNHGTSIKSLINVWGEDKIKMGEIGRYWVKGMLGGIPNYS